MGGLPCGFVLFVQYAADLSLSMPKIYKKDLHFAENGI
jgi:hypothetical protein